MKNTPIASKEKIEINDKIDTLRDSVISLPSGTGAGPAVNVKVSGGKHIPDYLGIWDQSIVKCLPNFQASEHLYSSAARLFSYEYLFETGEMIRFEKNLAQRFVSALNNEDPSSPSHGMVPETVSRITKNGLNSKFLEKVFTKKSSPVTFQELCSVAPTNWVKDLETSTSAYSSFDVVAEASCLLPWHDSHLLQDYECMLRPELREAEPVAVPNMKFYYPEPFVASPSFVHESLWFVHVLHYQHWLWFLYR